jgi:hypothetical protein
MPGRLRSMIRPLLFGLASDLHARPPAHPSPGRLDLAPEVAGLLAAPLGLLCSDDLEQPDAGLLLYDAFYRWARDAHVETHNWTTNRPKA